MATHFVSAIGFCFAFYCSPFSLRNTSNCQVSAVSRRAVHDCPKCQQVVTAAEAGLVGYVCIDDGRIQMPASIIALRFANERRNHRCTVFDRSVAYNIQQL